MTRKEEREQKSAEYVEGADKLYGYKPDIEDVRIAFLSGAEWADKTMLDKVCEWIEENYTLYEGVGGYYVAKELRKAMEG